jgi:hypothetical protein
MNYLLHLQKKDLPKDVVTGKQNLYQQEHHTAYDDFIF